MRLRTGKSTLTFVRLSKCAWNNNKLTTNKYIELKFIERVYWVHYYIMANMVNIRVLAIATQLFPNAVPAPHFKIG